MKKFELVNLGKEDLHWIKQMYQCDETQKYILGALKEEEAEQKAIDIILSNEKILFSQKLIQGGQNIGYSVLFISNEFPEVFEVGYVVEKKYHGQGFGGLMLSEFLKNLPVKLLNKDIIALVDIDNKASHKILENNGFKLSKTFLSTKYPDECIYYHRPMNYKGMD